MHGWRTLSASGEAAAKPEELEDFGNGLICLTGDGEGTLAIAKRQGSGRECLERLIRTFGRSNVYVELQRYYDRDEEARNQSELRWRIA